MDLIGYNKLYVYIKLYTNTYMRTITINKNTMNLKESKKVSGWRKGMRETLRLNYNL